MRRALAILTLLIAARSAASEELTGIASVIDGDTIEIHNQRIRLYGIDAPESRQVCLDQNGAKWRCGQRSALALSARVGNATISCEPRDRDRYGRVVAVCLAGKVDLGRWLVASGLAVAFRRYSLDYVADEEVARNKRLGMWAGSFDVPWEWRQTHRNR